MEKEKGLRTVMSHSSSIIGNKSNSMLRLLLTRHWARPRLIEPTTARLGWIASCARISVANLSTVPSESKYRHDSPWQGRGAAEFDMRSKYIP